MKDRILLTDHIQLFCDYLYTEEKSPATIEKYHRDICRFQRYAQEQEISKELTVDYKKQLEASGYAVRSINSMLVSLNRFLQYMGWDDCRVKMLRCQRAPYCTEEKELTKQEYLRLLDAAKGQPQLYLILQTICGTGVRVSELQYFTIEAIRRGTVTVRCKSKTRIILIPSKLRNMLLIYCKKQKIQTGPIFITRNRHPLDRSNIWAWMKKLCAAAQVSPTKVFPHNLRKLFARTFYSIEKDIAKLADILGHGSIETTRIYIMSTGDEHRRKIDRLGLVI